MSTTQRERRLTGKAALSAWPGRLAALKAEPTDDNLQRLCALLDGIDSWVVQRWDKPGHAERAATLAECRRQAREANRLVSDALQALGQRRAEETNRKRSISKASAVVSAPGAPPSVPDTGEGPAVA